VLPRSWRTIRKRSDNKGPEPEGVTLGTLVGRTYAFIGLERIGVVVVVCDVTNPRSYFCAIHY